MMPLSVNKYREVVNIFLMKIDTSFARLLKASLKKIHENLNTNIYIHIIRQRFSEATKDGNTQPLTGEWSNVKRYCPPLFIAPFPADIL